MTTLAWLESSSTDKARTDSSIVGDVKYSLTDALLLGTVLPFSSNQIELVQTLDLLFGRSGLSFFQNKPGEHLEETDAASKQKSLTDCLDRAVTMFLIKKILDAHLFLNIMVDPPQAIVSKVHAFEWSMMINSLLEKAFPVAPSIIHIIKGVSSFPSDVT